MVGYMPVCIIVSQESYSIQKDGDAPACSIGCCSLEDSLVTQYLLSDKSAQSSEMSAPETSGRLASDSGNAGNAGRAWAATWQL